MKSELQGELGSVNSGGLSSKVKGIELENLPNSEKIRIEYQNKSKQASKEPVKLNTKQIKALQRKQLYQDRINMDVKDILNILKIDLIKLAQMQKADISIGPIYEYIKSQDESHLNVLDDRIIKSILKDQKHYQINKYSILLYKDRYYIPNKIIFSLLYHIHSNKGHIKGTSMINEVKKHYYFGGIHDYVNALVRGCKECQLAKAVKTDINNNMIIQNVNQINMVWQVDFMGPFPQNGNYLYVMSGIDYFDSKVVLEPLPNIKGTTVIPALIRRIILPYGVMCIQSDLGQPFNSLMYKDLNDIFQVQVKFSSGYRPQTMGKIERSHSVINDMILVQEMIDDLLNKNKDYNELNWVNQLPYIESIMNSIQYKTKQGLSSNDIRYGPGQVRDCIEQMWKLYNIEPKRYVDIKTNKVDWKRYMLYMDSIRKRARYKSLMSKNEYDKQRMAYQNKLKKMGITINPTKYTKGEQVMVWARNGLNGNDRKFNSRWILGYYFQDYYGNNIILRDHPDESKAKHTRIITHRSNVRKYNNYMDIPLFYKENNYIKFSKWLKLMEKNYPHLKPDNVNKDANDEDYNPNEDV